HENYPLLSTAELEKEIQRLEAEMYQYAKDLEFEKAASTRDKLQALRAQFIANS
ncbi:MAG: UvrB/UvrC motif-containing protein, partial [Proteus hauseri]|nr:UvrB/UvrC motif-containing protein [Proteus hauseri]